MSEAIVRAVDLSKVYRLYAKPHYRFLDMFGLLPKRDGAYTEHRALDRINLEIRRGEKAAIIGRNGAGKSTLLKLATGVIEPTSGRIDVAEGAHALLQIGTGFHPDFTGRENAYSYLAHLGVTGKHADRKIFEIVEFAELEEYIDQPIKTYSTGMVARLMFATSTVISPKLLVLDEILGVGDAYFAQKSYERIKELCDTQGTTVLLVSHDVYSASKLCERMVWIDRGRVMIDGASPAVMKAYEDSIRAQEEARLRKRKETRLQALAQQGAIESSEHLLLEVRTPDNLPLPCPVFFSRIALRALDGREHELPLLSDDGGKEHETHLMLSEGCWGGVQSWGEREARPMLDHGSPFHKISAVFLLSDSIAQGTQVLPDVVLEYRSERPCKLIVYGYLAGQRHDYGVLPPSTGEWLQHVAHAKIDTSGELSSQSAPDISLGGVHGTGAISVDDVYILDENREHSFHLTHGRAMTMVIDYRIRKSNLIENAQVLVAFHRAGVQDVCRVITRELVFDGSRCKIGTIKMHVPKLFLANGPYSISVMIAKEGYYDDEPKVFYSINPGVYTCLVRAIEIEVAGGGTVGSGTGVVATADWSLCERALVSQPQVKVSNG